MGKKLTEALFPDMRKKAAESAAKTETEGNANNDGGCDTKDSDGKC